jgi:diaminohydroxyphosphoribosylaminopyrimidine deaminase/5-amino-6-(5-phosphoribosylamino)uracil reductase
VTASRTSERAWLARALALAGTVRGTSSPNPAVGCVLTRDGTLVGEGATAPVGGPHAEVVALAAAGAAARGATAHVTLEPCAHHGRTPPCTDALLAAGVARVVVAHPDPHPVAAGGAAVLRDAGVEVVGPLPAGDPLREAVAVHLEGFLAVVARGRPHVTLKLAQTLDGSLQVPGRRWVTGPVARAAVHRWRAAVDAVLVGSGTVLADDPRLDVRDVPSHHQPRPVVLDARLRTPVGAAVVRPGAVVVTAPGADPARADALRAAGASVTEVAPASGGGVDLPAALTALTGEGITSVLAEPGTTLATALVEAGVVDRLVLHVAPDAPGAADTPGMSDTPEAPDTSETPGRAGMVRRVVPRPPGGTWVPERLGGAGRDLVVHLHPGAPAVARTGAVSEVA